MHMVLWDSGRNVLLVVVSSGDCVLKEVESGFKAVDELTRGMQLVGRRGRLGSDGHAENFEDAIGGDGLVGNQLLQLVVSALQA